MAIVVFLAVLPLPRHFSGMKHDPDRFYHFAISKIYAENGFPEKVPQADDIGWGEAFAEKEYLFHVFTGTAYKFGGDLGVLWFTWALYAALAATFGYIIAVNCNSILMVPLGAIVMIAATGTFSVRMLMVRPHVLAILLMTWQLFFWSRGRWIAASVFGALYCLAYHAVYIPVMITFAFLVAHALAGENVKRRALWSFGCIYHRLPIERKAEA